MDAPGSELLDRMSGILAQVLRVALVYVSRFAVGKQQNKALAAALLIEMMTSMAQSGAHSCRQSARHAREPGLAVVVIGFIEILETVILHVVAAV